MEETKQEQVRTAGVIKRLKQEMDQDNVGRHLNEEDIKTIVHYLLKTITVLLQEQKRVVFENYFSIFLKRTNRRCSNLKTGESWMTYKNRLRFKSVKQFKDQVETDVD